MNVMRNTPRRVVVIANEACVGQELFNDIRERGEADGEPPEVILVAPALTSKLRYWLSDEDQAIHEAEQRVAESVERCGAAGIPVRAHVGDSDPLQALDDAMRIYTPDEVVVATHPPGSENWLEQGFTAQARARFDVPITHFVVDRAHDAATVATREEESRSAPVRERHRTRDVAILVIAAVLAIGGTLLSLVFYESDVSQGLLWAWVLVLDLGLKLGLAVALWLLFQRRPRADRLDF
jgi:nucleotide-binding universal stress UspA family protein